MFSRRWAATFWLWTLSLAVAAEQATWEPHDGLLVLHNGFVLSGRITPLGETYVVTFNNRGEAHIPRTEVEFECRDLEEAYRRKRDGLTSDDAAAHVKLAEWCLRHDLLPRAADQLLVARLRDPAHPMLAVLERRLESRAVLAAATPDTAEAAPTRSTEARPGPKAVLSSGLAPQLIQQFTTTIQPILMNRCATANCHGGGKTPYSLLRPAAGQVATSRMTHRNLQATLAYINRDQPENSRLLTMARQAHGNVATAVFTERSGNQLELLTAWIRRLEASASGSSSPRAPSASGGASSASPRVLPESASAPAGDAPSADGQPAGSSRPGPPLPAPANIPTRLPATNGQSDPIGRDPFDPEIFNRRFHGSGKPSAP